MIFPANQTHTEASHLKRANTMTEQRRKELKYEIGKEYPEGDEQSNSTLSRGRGAKIQNRTFGKATPGAWEKRSVSLPRDCHFPPICLIFVPIWLVHRHYFDTGILWQLSDCGQQWDWSRRFMQAVMKRERWETGFESGTGPRTSYL